MNITLNVPEQEQSVTITINFGKNGGSGKAVAESLGAALEAAVAETKADDELNMDYSACKGFDVNFMGFRTPIPVMGKQLKRKVAGLTDDPNTFVLNYFNFSTIQHAVRKMPVVS